MKKFKFLYIIVVFLVVTSIKVYSQESTYSDEDSKLTLVTRNGKTGVYDERKKIIVPCEFDEVNFYNPYKEGAMAPDAYFIVVTKNNYGENNRGIYNRKGKIIVPCLYEDVVFADNLLRVYAHNEKKGAYSYDGKMLYEPVYSDILYHTTSPFLLLMGGTKNNCNTWIDAKMGVGDVHGNIIVPCVYNYVSSPDGSNIYLVNKDGKYKSNAPSLNKSHIIGGKWGYFANGKEIIPCEFDKADEFGEGGVAKVVKDGQVKLIKNPLLNDKDIQIAENTYSPNKKKKGAPAVSRYPAPNSDIDKNIPMVKTNDKSSEFAFIIANENYPEAPVPYALNDGRIFKEYCSKTLGLPQKNIFMYEDATFGTIISAVEKLKEISNAYDGDASIIVYYAGHGVPDEKNNSAYILPVDGSSSDIETTGYSLAKFYKELSALNVKSAKVFLDACFSGAKREDEMLLSGRGVAIKVKDEVPQGNMVVFSASTGDETAHQLEDKGHGLFTYFLLKKIQETRGNISFGELSDYVTKQVKRQSVVINNKKQTPTVIPSPKVVNTWRNGTLR